MCGIAGFANPPGALEAAAQRATLDAMTRVLQHRGPDVQGRWHDAEKGIALGHTRLAILDLSHHGAQPMWSRSGRYGVTYNGEIYNFRDLRQTLSQLGAVFQGQSDTEVLLAAFDQWGVADTLPRLVGMFALAVWDDAARSVTLARDRLGEKPLFYGWLGSHFVFASELKALRCHPAWQQDIDRNALALFMRYAYIPAPFCVYEGLYKLPPGTYLTVPMSPWPHDSDAALRPKSYWSLKRAVHGGAAQQLTSDATAAASLDGLLRQAVQGQMIADVPLGAFLSGGIDSSVIVALMQAQSERPVQTYTIGFDVPGYNEAVYAAAVAKHLGTAHTEFYVTAKDALAVIPNLPTVYDEPHADASHIPAILVSELARQHVTVCLSGDGGDELFCGYNRYLHSERTWALARTLPPRLRRALGAGLASITPHAWDRLAALSPKRLPRTGYKVHKLADALRADSLTDVYRDLISYRKAPSDLVLGSQEPEILAGLGGLLDGSTDFLDQMLYWDMMTYLPDDNLAKMDRASMSVGLESRAPMLDHRVVEFAWRLPRHMKYRQGQSKWLLRQVLYQYVPRTLIDRPKMGFSVPVGAWLKDSLRDWAEALLDAGRLRREGFLDGTLVGKMWSAHLSGKREGQNELWAVLMFQAWLESLPTMAAST